MVESGGLLNRCTLKRRTEGSNPSLTAALREPRSPASATKLPSAKGPLPGMARERHRRRSDGAAPGLCEYDQPDNAVIVVAGRIDEAKTLELSKWWTGEKYEVTDRLHIALRNTNVVVMDERGCPHVLPLLTMNGVSYLPADRDSNPSG